MRAMVFEQPGAPLRLVDRPIPVPSAGQVLLKVQACGLCGTDLHLVDGELPDPMLPVIPGHQIIGSVVAAGPGAHRYPAGTRVGVPWLGWTCGTCTFCTSGRENLCEHARFTGYTLDGGYAEYAVADERYCFPIDQGYPPSQAAPLLCAGLIGYRAWRFAGTAHRLGLYGFGAAAHIVLQLARHQGQEVYAMTRPGDEEAQQLANSLGATWAGSTDDDQPETLDAAIIFAPAGELVPLALGSVRPGGTVVCAGIHMTDIPSFPYRLLWGERVLRSVANLTRRDSTLR